MERINKRFYSLLGLCQKAGKLVSGAMLSEKAIKAKKAKLIIVSNEASPGTQKQFTNLCDYYNIVMITGGNKEEMGRAIGKLQRTVITVIDDNFKNLLLNAIEEIQHGGDQ